MDDCSSDSSVVEIEIEKRFPPVIHLDEEEIILNVNVPGEPCSDPVRTSTNKHVQCFNESQNANDPDHWTEDMRKFYNNDWGNEDLFVVKNIQEKMNNHPDLWKVSSKDVLSFYSKKKQCKLRCWNCCQYGHTISNCPDPLHEQKCHMCGESGHDGKSCPSSKCLNCGAASRTFINMCNKCTSELKKKCSRCHLEGHHFINCTDHWRKYHYTTKTKEIQIPEYNINKPVNELFCSNCSRKGHHHQRCNWKKNPPSYPDALPFIASYDDLFSSPVEKTENGKKRRYFEEESAQAKTAGLSWPEKVRLVTKGESDRDSSGHKMTTAEDVTVLFERKEKRPMENPFRNWEEWFARGRRKNKNKKRNKGNYPELPKKRNKKVHHDAFAPENKNARYRKEMVIHRTKR